MASNYKCPKCGAPLEDLWDGEPVSAFIGEWSEDRFRCDGHVIRPLPFPIASENCTMNRTKSCGYFGLEDLGVEYSDDFVQRSVSIGHIQKHGGYDGT